MTTHIEPPPSLIEAREQRRKESRRKVLFGVLAVSAVLAAVTWLFAYSSVFVVKNVEVQGVSRLSAVEVDSSLGQVRGDKLALLDIGELESGVESLSAVAGAEVSREWPAGMRVVVQERPSLAVVSTPDGDFSLDDTGTLFQVPGVDPVGPRVEMPADAEIETTLRVVSQVLVALPKDVRDAVVAVQAPSPNDVQFELTGDRIVVWGTADKSDDKGEVLEVLLKQEGAWFDVSSPNLPVTRESAPKLEGDSDQTVAGSSVQSDEAENRSDSTGDDAGEPASTGNSDSTP